MTRNATSCRGRVCWLRTTAHRGRERRSHRVVGVQAVQQRRVGLQGVGGGSLVSLQATGHRVGHCRGRGDRRRDGRPDVVARSRTSKSRCRRRSPPLRQPKPTSRHPRCPVLDCFTAACASRPTASAAARGRREHRSRRRPALLPAKAVRSFAIGHAGDRGDPHTRHTGAAERDTATAAGSRPELVDPGRRPQARLGTLVIVRVRT